MSDASHPIECGAHGRTPSTYVCGHLAWGVACGYHAADAETAGDLWPDAWCDRCDLMLADTGGWTEEATAAADLQVLCTHCYEAARARNRSFPEEARRLGCTPSGRQVDEFIHACVHAASELNRRADAEHTLGQHARWEYDADAGKLEWHNDGRIAVSADVELIGSFSTRTNTWQWAWANPNVTEQKLVAHTRLLHAFGVVRGIEKLTEEKWSASEADAWAMASVAAVLLDGVGIYRAPFEHLYYFMLLRTLRSLH